MPWPMEVPKGRIIVSDTESNGLLPGMSGGGDIPPMDRLHSATSEDINTGEHHEWNPDTIGSYWEWLMDEVGVIIGHNFLGFDSRAIKYVYPKFDPTRFLILDTLIICKKVWPADVLIGPDMQRFRAGKFPAKYLKRQSLGAWGYRLGNYKGEYDGGWEHWSPSMQEYMVQDGKVNLDLWRLIERRIGWNTSTATASSPAQVSSSGLSFPLLSQPITETRANQRPAWATDDQKRNTGMSLQRDLPPALSSQKVSSENSAPAPTESAPKGYVWPWMPFWIEHEMAKIVTEQETRGVHFDRPSAEALTTELRNRQEAMGRDLAKVFGAWWQPVDNPETGRKNNRDRTRICREHPDITLPRFGKKGLPLKDYVGPPKEYYFEGSPYCRIKRTTFNPRSRDHLADRLQKVFGWKPSVRTASGKPQVDEGVIKALPSAVIEDHTRSLIMDYFVVTKTLGMLAEGNKAWLQYCDEAGRIHGRVDPLGTIYGRAAHFNPNLGQIMSVKVEEIKDPQTGRIITKKPIMDVKGGFGAECRSLFTATPDEGFEELTGTDMASLEFVLLGHYLWPFDGGAFSKRACDPDISIHEVHGEMAGLSKADAKTIGYLRVFGGGAWKAGVAVGVTEDEIPALLLDRGLPQRLNWLRKIQGPNYEEPSDLDKARIVKGGRVIKKYDEAITGLKDLIDDIKLAATRGYVIGIDGSKLIVRKAHAALNALLQGGGAAACKLWIILFHQKMAARGYKLRVHYNQVLWVHDEKQNEHRKGLGQIIAEVSEEAAREAGVMLGLRGTFRTESKTGRNWKETH